MNQKKYDAYEYPVRKISDLKDLFLTSTDLFADVAAYLVKNKETGAFEPITYRQVRQDVEALGTRLIAMGLKGKRIAIIGATSYEWLLSEMAIVCGTGCKVPLDKNLPPDEVRNLIRRSGASAIIYSKKMEKTIRPLMEEPGQVTYFICMTEDRDPRALFLHTLIEEGRKLLAEGDRRFVDAPVRADDLAAILFTSGTTGASKGVLLSHKNIASNIMNMSRRENLKPGWVVLSVLPVHHTLENTCVDWTTFYQGRTLAICEGIRYILKDMNAVRANVVVGVPLLFEKIFKGMMKQAQARGEGEKIKRAIELSRRLKLYRNRPLMKRLFKPIHQAFGGDMRIFITGGAAIDPTVIESFEAMGIPMLQGYGMTESSPIIAMNYDRYNVASSVGRPLRGTLVRIDDPDENGIGEICCQSDSVMMGYFEDPEATKRALAGGYLHTGDLGYMDEEGYLYITGRKKTVIVTKGGKNIFPEEIEDLLKQNELIKECLVHGVTDRKVGNVIVAVDILPDFELLSERKGDLTDNEIYQLFRAIVDENNDRMPPYKMVKRVHIRKVPFEMTTTGKIKRYGNFIEGEDNVGSQAYIEAKNREKTRAEAFLQAARSDGNPLSSVPSARPITDLRDLFRTSAGLYPDRPAVYQRPEPGTPYQAVTYRKAAADINGLGTALTARGYKGERIALIGRSGYRWLVTYLAVTGGLGILCPFDAGLNEEAMEAQLEKTGARLAFCDKEVEGLLRRIVERGKTKIETLIPFDGSDPLTWQTLVEEGKEMMAVGDRQYLDIELLNEEVAEIICLRKESAKAGKNLGDVGENQGKEITDGRVETRNEGLLILSQRDITENIMALSAISSIEKDDVVFVAPASYPLDSRIFQLLLPLYQGAAVAFGSRTETMLRDMGEVGPTCLLTSPKTLETLVKKVGQKLIAAGKAPSLARLMRARSWWLPVQTLLERTTIAAIKNFFGSRLRLIIVGSGTADPELGDVFHRIGIETVSCEALTEKTQRIACTAGIEAEQDEEGGKTQGGREDG